ncbi:Hypothetical_protein [Hexamita inflata]|uniref:Hypothetical_protein n=1 Tax=Hexamita inflata TaxID=28002 RepID=A0AA86TT10_9EUKA|nr:Hypothetical protein HINF_LOCUS15524 [Hexamita inflata]
MMTQMTFALLLMILTLFIQLALRLDEPIFNNNNLTVELSMIVRFKIYWERIMCQYSGYATTTLQFLFYLSIRTRISYTILMSQIYNKHLRFIHDIPWQETIIVQMLALLFRLCSKKQKTVLRVFINYALNYFILYFNLSKNITVQDFVRNENGFNQFVNRTIFPVITSYLEIGLQILIHLLIIKDAIKYGTKIQVIKRTQINYMKRMPVQIQVLPQPLILDLE